MTHAPYYFCHGIPGSPMDAKALWPGPERIQTPNFLDAGEIAGPEAWIAQFDRFVTADAPVHLIGFSIGAMMALHIAAARPEKVGQITLISAAAPLQLGDFLRHMAGAPVFKLAQKQGPGLGLLTKAQGSMLRYTPEFLLRQLFAKSGVAEKDWTAQPDARRLLLAALRAAYHDHPNAYKALLRHYVSDWTGVLEEVKAPVTLWHGDRDTWAPIAMAEALRSALPHEAEIQRVHGGGHYSTLQTACETLSAPLFNLSLQTG